MRRVESVARRCRVGGGPVSHRPLALCDAGVVTAMTYGTTATIATCGATEMFFAAVASVSRVVVLQLISVQQSRLAATEDARA